MPQKSSADKPKPKTKYKNIPAALSQAHIDDIDAIAKAENMSRSEVIRRAVEAFAHNYQTDQLDQRQLKLEKKMQTMEDHLASLLAKNAILSAQALYFSCLPYSKGTPKAKLTPEAFQALVNESGFFAKEQLQPKGKGKKNKAALLQADESSSDQTDDQK
jgi:Arc/MetJ-type ribon-helix-helix transcriptional regulator